jgi:hypothetical protein
VLTSGRMRLHQVRNGCANGFRPDQLTKKVTCACIVVENLGLAFGQEDVAHCRSVSVVGRPNLSRQNLLNFTLLGGRTLANALLELRTLDAERVKKGSRSRPR